jgi:hypothetical protein
MMIKNTIPLVFLLTCLSVHAAPFNLDGQMSPLDQQGHYSVSINDDQEGHQFKGDATDIGNGALQLALKDNKGKAYSGTATNADGKLYDFTLKDSDSETNIGGTLTVID